MTGVERKNNLEINLKSEADTKGLLGFFSGPSQKDELDPDRSAVPLQLNMFLLSSICLIKMTCLLGIIGGWLHG